MIDYLTVEEVIEIHDRALEQFGGLSGIRDKGSLESAIENIKATMFGADLYHSIYDKASALLHGIVSNHAFNDANKRTGLTATLLFLKGNGITISFSMKAFEDFVVEIANGQHSREEIANFLEFGGK